MGKTLLPTPPPSPNFAVQMKFRVNRDHFSVGLAQVMNVAGGRNALPILNNTLLEAAEGVVSLTATNLDLGIRCRVRADIMAAGGITLPVRKLGSIVSNLPSLDVEVEATSGQQARIESGSSRFRMMGMGKEDFPPLPQFPGATSYTVGQEDLQRMLKCVAYAQSQDESRHIMNGVFFQFDPGKLTLAATDGRRLAVIQQELGPSAAETGGHFILPSKTVAVVDKLLGQGANVTITFNDRQVAFEIQTADDDASGLKGGIYLVSKVVEGTYPEYRKVIPREGDQFVRLNREGFLTTVHRASLVASDKNNSVKLKFSTDLLEITSASAEFGDSHERMGMDYKGPDVLISFNPNYLMDPLKALARDEVILEFKDELSPGVFRTPDGFLCVIMPLRLT